MFHRIACVTAFAAAGLLASVSPAIAQEEASASTTAGFEAWSPSWSSSEIEKLATALTGSWTSADAGNVIMVIAPAPVEGMTDTLYVEQYTSDNMGSPYRESFYQFYTKQGKPRLRTLEMKLPDDAKGVFAAMGLVPEAFPEIAADQLIATLDLDIKPSAGGFTGKTPYPYPTAVEGAVEMTSSLTVQGDKLIAAATGFAPDGTVAWGGEKGYEFKKTASPIKVDRRENGLVVVDLAVPEGDAVADGDTLHVDYAGWLGDGTMFDTSRQAGRSVFRFAYPPRLIEGWNTGLDGVTVGTHRRLVIPSELGYGTRGQPSAKIPPDSTLYFEIEVRAIQKPETAPEAGPGEGATEE